MSVIPAIMAVRELCQWWIDVHYVDTNQAYALAAPIATSLAGGGPVVMLWGLALPNRLSDARLMLALDGSSFLR